MDKKSIRYIKGGNDMNKEVRKLNLTKIRKKKSIIISTKEALKDVVQIDWSDDVLSGKKKIIVQ